MTGSGARQVIAARVFYFSFFLLLKGTLLLCGRYCCVLRSVFYFFFFVLFSVQLIWLFFMGAVYKDM